MLKRFGWACLVLAGANCASGFALLGPLDSEEYQVPAIAYQLPGDIGTPKNLGEEYRRNTPVMYFSVDANFLDYFGSNGLVAVEQAFTVFNNLSNVSSYTPGLWEWPMEAQRVNYQAEALALWDLKSVTMNLLIEQVGLAEPERYTWTLHDRLVGQGGCPADVTYLVIKRNFDPEFSPLGQVQSSSYVNGTLYSYVIIETCNPPDPVAEAVEFPVDPLANTFTAIASFPPNFGYFFTGLTRDDVGGLRYLLRTNNLNIEAAGLDTVTYITNSTPQLLFSSNLSVLADLALVNDAATLQALYPGLVVSESYSYFTNVITTNVIFYFTNLPWSPSTAPATLASATEFVTNIVTHYGHRFANVYTNTYYTNTLVGILETNIGACPPPAPANSTCTNITYRTEKVAGVSGDFFLVPPGLCDISIVSTQLIRVLATTNLVLVATNQTGNTNIVGQEFSLSVVDYFTNYVVVIKPVICPPNTVALRQGIERMRFVRQDFDSLLNRFFYPVTNTYMLNALTNNTLIPQKTQRLVLVPDFLLTAQDLATTPTDGLIGPGGIARGISFDETAVNPGLAGPGVILSATSGGFIYNKVGPIYLNASPNFMDEQSAAFLFIWGTFDGSTNAPIVYPNGTSVLNLEHQVLIQVHPPPPTLPNAKAGVSYGTLFSGFTATGSFLPPATWSLAPGSPGLPPGLTLNPNGTITGIPGAGTTGLTYDFTVRMSDAAARFVDTPYEITIVP
jgi:hypothetical protein